MTNERPDATAVALEELAEDMLRLLERVAAIEQRLDGLGSAAQEAALSQGRAVDALRRDLLGDRSALASRATLAAVAPVLDSLQAMRRGLDAESSPQVHAQVSALAGVLTGLLQSLGFRSFEPGAGEPFDSGRMEALGRAPGMPGAVACCLQPGWLAGAALVRPAGVLVGEATAPEPLREDRKEGEA